MKSYDDIRHYKRMYYLANKDRLCNYSTNYYKYKKCNGEFSNEEIDSQLRLFIKKYKKHSEIKDNRIQIRKNESIVVSFN